MEADGRRTRTRLRLQVGRRPPGVRAEEGHQLIPVVVDGAKVRRGRVLHPAGVMKRSVYFFGVSIEWFVNSERPDL